MYNHRALIAGLLCTCNLLNLLNLLQPLSVTFRFFTIEYLLTIKPIASTSSLIRSKRNNPGTPPSPTLVVDCTILNLTHLMWIIPETLHRDDTNLMSTIPPFLSHSLTHITLAGHCVCVCSKT